MIKTQNISFTYNTNEHVFHFPNIKLSHGEHLLVLGKSGVGKTTLLHLIAGLLVPRSGNICINDIEINALSNSKRDTFRGTSIGMVFQKKHALSNVSVINNLKIRLFFTKKNEVPEINILLKQLGLFKIKNYKVKELSEGQFQRLSVALAVIHQPKVILADEPTSSLDDENCQIVIELLIAQAKEKNANLIVITHDQRIKSYFKNAMEL
jgi:putative ABC transport system ATP-binding protein